MTIVSGRPDIFGDTFHMEVVAGMTLEQIVRAAPGIPEWFWELGTVCIDGAEIERENWRRVRPRETRNGEPVVVTLHPPIPEGGGKGKQILTILATVVLAIATAGIATFGIPAIGIAAGSTAAALVSTSVGIIGRNA